ncbi:DUF2062 domain-containing protein [Luteolibacter sp. AS25]|uniref:DUF2062 domain-containing protein n=1 Tax=Luteolibacter sp. AS25 TaxID=3135776 RepID=UPI00398B58F1
MPSDDPQSPSRFRRWIINPILKQLKQGTSPERLSWSVSLGITLGTFPIMGSTSLVCFIAGHLFRLNQPVLHLFKTLTYPVHLPLILVFIRLGQKINGVPLLTLSIPEMLGQFKDSPTRFARDFGVAALHGIEAWAICSLVLIPLVYFIALPLLRKLLPEAPATPQSDG